MKFFIRHRGSISLFLAIIMLPCLTFTGIMVDMANMTLSKPVVESAGALAANAALANYDTVLEEVYGLFAMSQKADNPEEALMENLKQYFTDSIKANGLLSDEDSMDLSSKLLGSLKDALYQNESDDINQNFLKISLADLQGTYLEDSSLANSEILKTQIIEYMKYRGPVAVTMSLMDSLGAFKKMNKQSPVAESKMRVDEKLGDLAKTCKEFYDALKKYDEKVKEYEQAEVEYEKINFEDQMQELHKDIVKYLLFEVKYIDHLKFIDSDKSWGPARYDDITSTRREFDYIVNSNSELISHMVRETAGMGTYLNPDVPNMYKVQQCFDEYYKEFYPDVAEPIMNLDRGIAETIEDLKDDISDLEDDECSAVLDENGNEISPAVDHSSEIAALNEKIGEWRGLQQEINSKLQEYNADVSRPMQGHQTTYKQTVADAKGRATERIRNMFPCLFNMYDKAQEVGKKGFHGFFNVTDSGDYAQGKGEMVKMKLQEVTKANGEFGRQIEIYGEEDDFQATMESNRKKTAEQFKPEDVDVILDQLEAGRRYLTNEGEPLGVIPTLQDYVFYGKHIVAGPDTGGGTSGGVRSDRFDPSGGEGKVLDYMVELAEKMLEAEIGVEHGDSGITADYVDTLYANHVNLPRDSVLHRRDDSPYPSSQYYLKMVSEAGVEVKDKAETINVPAFYVYLATTYGGTEDTEVKNQYKAIKEEGKKANKQAIEEGTDETPEVAYNRDVFQNVPSDIISTEEADLGKFNEISDKDSAEIDQFSEMKESNGSFLNILNGALENVRDNTFLLAYVSENFSNYGDTIEVNGKVKGEGKKTMTNVPINRENNKIYGCEMEYITYGKKGTDESGWWIFKKGSTGPETNISIVKRDIYGVRLAFNTIYALTDGEIDSWTKPPAIAIQAASQGVIPYQLVQVVAKMALALTESAIDLQLIMKGEKVAVVKTKDTWKCQVNPDALAENLSSALTEQANAHIDGAITYLQKVVDNGVEWTTEEITGLSDEIGDDLQSIFDGALRDEASTLANIATNELEQAYFEIYTRGEEYIESELLNRVEKSMDKYISTQSEENRKFLKTAKQKVLITIVERGKNYLQKASDYMKKGMKEGLSDAELDMSAYSEMMKEVSDAQVSYMSNMTQGIADQAVFIVKEAGEEIKGCIKFQGNQLKKGVSDEVSKKTTEVIKKYFPKNIQDVNFGKEGVVKKSDSVSNTIYFGYEEYLSLFMFLRLCSGNQDDIVRRIGDVIQINTASGITLKNEKQYEAQDGYQLSKAYTYVSLKAKVEVKPLLLSEKLFQGNIGKHLKYFSYEYKNIAGY